THPHRKETGGLSGRPLTALNRAPVRRAYRLSGGRLPVVGVGGVFTPEDAYAMIRAGASLVEVYTAFVYGGPGLPSRLHSGLAGLLRRDGFRHVSEAVGVDA
ncbi:MAG: quinone-dependent dihydroorotate dehydrogenase, partial [Deinococcus sp.]